MKVAVAPESVPRLGARAALEIPLISVEVHNRHAAGSGFFQERVFQRLEFRSDWRTIRVQSVNVTALLRTYPFRSSGHDKPVAFSCEGATQP